MMAILDVVAFVAHELMLFSVVGFVIGGADDLLIDLIWMCRTVTRRTIIYRRQAGANSATLQRARSPGRTVVFVPAWDEGSVIGPMLAHAVSVFGGQDYRIYVGCYPNDPITLAVVGSIASPHIRVVVGQANGPTTKAGCLNTLWQALVADERAEGWSAKSIVLHDAEDVVHSAELRVFDRLIERFDFVQLPVLPLVDAGSRWIGGHYIDEFAEAHGKMIVVREAIGAGIPAAGVGCAFAREIMGRIADSRGGAPFDHDSLTEDYELGLRVAELGGRGIFVRLPHAGGGMVAVRAHFPATLDEAVRQKSRWIAGIALSGWDRLGWHGGIAESWMRLHDRRALACATILLAAYAGLVLTVLLQLANWSDGAVRPVGSPLLGWLLLASGLSLFWRLAMRFAFVTAAYGWREGARAIPRAIISNVIAMMAARRAVFVYLRMRRDGVVRWDKTAHAFPTILPAE
ncbi:glycosyl transferase family protein [Sphingomonas paeninsulae]|jgi:adsorption protein B|uniref:Glycosyl transferase family protein n=1 Tax=Sphingomonas paeninsulae TaxID=2319844 RepID=A0A494TMI6_SPHPE|nr:glycosyl transferase family protein [Sphingomonas paeninsulae]AYJ86648.1 glycosyl transferase family protein [Sphingomonas paeninsulae]